MMRSLKVFCLCLLAFFLTGGLCDSSPESAESEETLEAAERLQQPRNLYEGNVNENLHELRQDLEETASDRQGAQDRQIERDTP